MMTNYDIIISIAPQISMKLIKKTHLKGIKSLPKDVPGVIGSKSVARNDQNNNNKEMLNA